MKRLPLLLLSLCSAFVVLAGDIRSAKELVAFADAVNNGADISAWQNDKGEVTLACDISKKVQQIEIRKEIDKENAGIVYYVTENGAENIISKTDYDKWYNSYFSAVESINVSYVNLTKENIENVTSK